MIKIVIQVVVIESRATHVNTIKKEKRKKYDKPSYLTSPGHPISPCSLTTIVNNSSAENMAIEQCFNINKQ